MEPQSQIHQSLLQPQIASSSEACLGTETDAVVTPNTLKFGFIESLTIRRGVEPAVIIAGSRGSFPVRMFFDYANAMLKPMGDISVYLRDENTLVDKMAKRWCNDNQPTIVTFPADWKKLGGEAGIRRNRHMCQSATHALLFWDGYSKDIDDLYKQCRRYGVKTKLVFLEMEG